MSRYVILHDRRLIGQTPFRTSIATLEVDENTSLVPVLTIITSLSQLDGTQGLFILCHGYAGVNNRGKACADAGGMGLQLGMEGIMHDNVASWRAIRGAVLNIVVYACGAADTQAGNQGTVADGRYLMGALAIYTGATVYAADRIQWYTTGGSGVIDFGAWEGTLWMFDPSGSSTPAPGNRVPIELSEI